MDQDADCQAANDSGDRQDGRVDKGDGGGEHERDHDELARVVRDSAQHRYRYGGEQAALCAAAIIAQDSTPPAMLKASICGLAKSMVEHATLISIRMKAGLAPMRSSAKRTIALPKPSLTPVMVTGRGTRTSR